MELSRFTIAGQLPHTNIKLLPRTMRASIIIISYNGLKYLESCISSLMSEVRVEDEIILLDNGSVDNCIDLVEKKYPIVRTYRNKENLGFAMGCNQAAALARGDYLIFLNQDTRVQKGWLVGLLDQFEKDPIIGLVTSKLILMSDPERIQMCGQEVHFTGFTFGRGFMSPAESYNSNERVGAVTGASFAIRHSLWEELGGFDKLLFMYYEETDLSWRARLAGYESQFSPSSVVLHDYSVGGSQKEYDYSQRNRWVLLLKNWKGITLLFLLPSLLLAEIIDWVYMVMLGRRGVHAKVRALGWLIINFIEVLRARGKVQIRRKEPDWVLLKACSWKLKPRLYTGGWIGKIAVGISNLLFRTQYCLLFFFMKIINI